MVSSLVLGFAVFAQPSVVSGGPPAARPDIDIEFVNHCGFDVSFAWYQTTCDGVTPNILFLNERLPHGGTTARVAQSASFAGGRIYAWSSEDTFPDGVLAMSQGTFETFMALDRREDKCGDEYARYRVGVPPFVGYGAFAELTFTRSGAVIINDADVSNVEGYYIPLSWDFVFEHSGGKRDPQCFDTGLFAGLPKKEDCEANGGSWEQIAAGAYAGAPAGHCRAPWGICQSTPLAPVCSSQYYEAFQPLIAQLDAVYVALQAERVGPAGTGPAAFTWSGDDRTTFPGQIWSCIGTQNTKNFKMSEMCGAINRGLCDLASPKLGSMSPGDFAAWTQSECGLLQMQEPPGAWFKAGYVRNPYAYWLRRTLAGTTYSFPMDEGPYGGNAQCNTLHGQEVPLKSRVTACPSRSPDSASVVL